MKRTEAAAYILTNPGTKVRVKGWDSEHYITVDPTGDICFDDGSCADINGFINDGWEILKEPVKYETHIWLPHEPSLNLDYNENRQFLERLTDSSYYLDNESNGYNRKIKITVEETT